MLFLTCALIPILSLDIEYSLDGTTFVEFASDDPDTPEDESYTVDSLFNDQTPVDNTGTDFDLSARDMAILAEGEAALFFFQLSRPGAPAACNAAAGAFRQVCIDGSNLVCPDFNHATVNGVDTPDIGDACANTLATFSIDIDFDEISALDGLPNYETQWFRSEMASSPIH